MSCFVYTHSYHIKRRLNMPCICVFFFLIRYSFIENKVIDKMETEDLNSLRNKVKFILLLCKYRNCFGLLTQNLDLLHEN